MNGSVHTRAVACPCSSQWRRRRANNSPTDGRRAIQSLAEHAARSRRRVSDRGGDSSPDPPSEYAFLLKLASVRIKAMDARGPRGAGDGTDRRRRMAGGGRAEGTAPYVDLAPIAPTMADPSRGDRADARQQSPTSDPSAGTAADRRQLGRRASSGRRTAAVTALSRMGEPAVVGSTFAGTVECWRRRSRPAAALKICSPATVVVDDARVSLAIEAGGRDVTAVVPHRSSTTPPVEECIWRTGRRRLRRTVVNFSRRPVGRRPVVRDPLRRDVAAVQGFSWDERTKVSRLTRAASATPLVLDFTRRDETRLVSRTDVSATGA